MLLSWWRNLSVVKKLYGVMGIMLILISSELGTLYFSMNTLSAIRTFVAGEGLWSKAQKSAVQSLQKYVLSGDENFWSEYQRYLRVPLGDRIARLELIKPNIDYDTFSRGLIQGRNHPDDIAGFLKFLQRFHEVPYVKEALDIWTVADYKLDDLIATANDIHANLTEHRRSSPEVKAALGRLYQLDSELTVLEDRLSYAMGEGSRWAERTVMLALLMVVLSIELTGLIFTFSFGRNLSRSLREMNLAAGEVGKGNFEQRLPVRSQDELGQLASSINRMTEDLKHSMAERAQAESANKIKSLFLANMSHEIRTPLGVIQGLVEILKSTDVSSDENRKYLETIQRTSMNLNQVINDILDISKVEAGHLEIHKAPFNLTEVLGDLAAMFEIKAQSKNLEIQFKARGEVPAFISTDCFRLRQILINLINNAVKFTDHGCIKVDYWVSDLQIYFKISDSGIGMTEKDQRNIFALFYQADASISKKYEGTGLGLVLSKRLAKAMGGDVNLIESSVGMGSTFLFQIHFEPADESQMQTSFKRTAGIDIPPGKRILVVEDNPDNQLITRVFLTKNGLNVDFAGDGREGVEKALSQDYDLILMDMQMPVMDGYAATQSLRAQGYSKPIVALTAHAMSEERARCLEVGCSSYLSKPFESKTLLSTISHYLSASI
jgi:signal transduction histidine kinase/CheY-like chemotaxis protein